MELRYDETDLAKEKAVYFLKVEYGLSFSPSDIQRVEWTDAVTFVIHLVLAGGIPRAVSSGGSKFVAQYMRQGRRDATGTSWTVG